MEEQRIVEVVFADKLQKVVAVLRCLVVELDADVAHRRLNQHLRTFSRFDDSGCVSGSRRCLFCCAPAVIATSKRSSAMILRIFIR